MTAAVLRKGALLLPLLCGLSIDTAAQEGREACEPDEIDMGDYCAKRPPEAAVLRPGAKRATPFRAKSMMPGIVGEPTQPGPEESAPEPAGQPAVPGSGFGVQLGAFSTRAKASEVARSAAAAVDGPFALAPIQRNERILWACIHGPFPDKAAAIEAQRRLRQNTRFTDAFVKALDELELLDLEHATTEK
jgi:cell division septation protein DedD